MQEKSSPASLIASLSASERAAELAKLTEEEAAALLYDWTFWARPGQLPPVSRWYIWLLLAGRGYGKTRALTELVRSWAAAGYSPIALVGQTKADVRDTIVELGDSSILKISPPWFMPEYEPSKRRLTWPNGVQAIIYSGDEPDQLRGPQHMKAAVDELAKYLYPQQTWDNLMMGLRVGDNPQAVIATTPRPIKILKELVRQSNQMGTRVSITRGHTLDNRANLAPQFLAHVLEQYQGTRLGRQELEGVLLETMEGLVYDAFKADMCIIPRFAIPDDWPRYFGMDFGTVNTAAVWYAMEPATGFLYCYSTYRAKASVVEHVKEFTVHPERYRRRVGGNHQEENIREAYTLAGWPLAEPIYSNDRKARITRVNSLHAQNRVYYFSDQHEIIDEKMSFAYEIDKDDTMTDKIHNESQYHLMSAEGYIVSEFRPVDIVHRDNQQRVVMA